MKVVRIHDRSCGSGKSTEAYSNFSEDTKYLVIVPLLEECNRVIEAAPVPFVQPERIAGQAKRDHLVALVQDGCNIVATHALYGHLVEVIRKGLLDGYSILIDEVPDVCHQKTYSRVTKKDIENVYIPQNLITICPDTQRVTPTDVWLRLEDDQKTYDDNFLRDAKTGCLYFVGDSFFVFAIPVELLQAGTNVEIMTFLAEGSLLLKYLQCMGIAYTIDSCADDLARFKAEMKRLLTVHSINNIDHPKQFTYTFSWQNTALSTAKKNALEPRWKRVSVALKNLYQRKLRKKVAKSDIIITCAKAQWLSSGDALLPSMAAEERKGKEKLCSPGPMSQGTALLKGVWWVPNTTRGTNDYRHCSTAIYLYNQHLAPAVIRWLGIKDPTEFEKRYAITELIQWLYRTRIRDGEPVDLYMPSARMRKVLEEWLDEPVAKTVVALRAA